MFFEDKMFLSFKLASLSKWESARYVSGSRPSCFWIVFNCQSKLLWGKAKSLWMKLTFIQFSEHLRSQTLGTIGVRSWQIITTWVLQNVCFFWSKMMQNSISWMPTCLPNLTRCKISSKIWQVVISLFQNLTHCKFFDSNSDTL